MKRIVGMVCCVFFAAGLAFSLPSLDERAAVVVRWLNEKPFVLDHVKFADDAFTKAAISDTPNDLEVSLDAIGVSLYSLLRNEVFARHGYAFKSQALQNVFADTSWYRANPKFTFDTTSALENANIKAIQELEGRLDYETVETWIDSLPGLSDRFVGGDVFRDTEPESKVRFALNHLKLLPAEVLRNYLLAMYGARAEDARYERLFSDLLPNVRRNLSIEDAASSMTRNEKANIEFLQLRELYERKDAVTYSMPAGVTALPALGAELYFYRTLPAAGGDLHYGGLEFSYLNHTIAVDNHVTDPATVLPDTARRRVESASGALAQLRAFFQGKAYEGYTDTVVFNQSDFVPPPAIRQALQTLNLDYLQLLRREIHARHGAEVLDAAYAAIFSRCPWYKPHLRPTLATESRLPAGTLSVVEMTNFALLEGEMVHRSKIAPEAFGEGAGYVIVDMNTVQACQVVFGSLGGPQLNGYGSVELDVGQLVRFGRSQVDFSALVDQIRTKNGFDIYVRYRGGC